MKYIPYLSINAIAFYFVEFIQIINDFEKFIILLLVILYNFFKFKNEYHKFKNKSNE